MDNELIRCVIDPNKMYATIALQRPEGEENIELSAQMFEDYLKGKGITFGLNYAALEALSYCIEYDKEIEVARGKPAVDGADGHFDFYVEMEDKKAKPVVAADGSVDYMNSLNIAMVEEGQVFARYVEPTNGEYGFDIFSEMLKPKPGKPASSLRGKGFAISEDGFEYTATKSGRIYMDGGKVMIDPLYTVSGDLDVSHGNIKFNGDVEVRGDMRSGTKIEADGSIFISGHVGSCEIYAGQNVTIGKGVQGKYNCKIVAGGDVAGNFCEYCSITAGGKVYANSLLDCDVNAGNSIIVTSKMGCIIGGQAKALQLIQARNLGNETEVSTKLMIGVFPDVVEKLKKYKERKSKVEQDILLFDEKQKSIDKVPPDARTKEILELKKQITQAKILRGKEKLELENKITTLEANIEQSSKSALVVVNEVVYPGVRVFSQKASLAVDTAYREVVFRPHYGEVQMMSAEEYKNIQS